MYVSIYVIVEFEKNLYNIKVENISEQGRSMKSDEEQKIATSLRVSCWLNDASWLHLNDFLRAIKLCIQIVFAGFVLKLIHNVDLSIICPLLVCDAQVSVQRCSSFKAYTPYSISIG
ncbi:peptidyl-prolyl cis-trans isomerase FKBP62 [Trifolium repens]|nr:peptidyl-prolyl cis-trans isomerase FKBP62 [Trifolium repens]